MDGLTGDDSVSKVRNFKERSADIVDDIQANGRRSDSVNNWKAGKLPLVRLL